MRAGSKVSLGNKIRCIKVCWWFDGMQGCVDRLLRKSFVARVAARTKSHLSAVQVLCSGIRIAVMTVLASRILVGEIGSLLFWGCESHLGGFVPVMLECRGDFSNVVRSICFEVRQADSGKESVAIDGVFFCRGCRDRKWVVGDVAVLRSNTLKRWLKMPRPDSLRGRGGVCGLTAWLK